MLLFLTLRRCNSTLLRLTLSRGRNSSFCSCTFLSSFFSAAAARSSSSLLAAAKAAASAVARSTFSLLYICRECFQLLDLLRLSSFLFESSAANHSQYTMAARSMETESTQRQLLNASSLAFQKDALSRRLHMTRSFNSSAKWRQVCVSRCGIFAHANLSPFCGAVEAPRHVQPPAQRIFLKGQAGGV